MPIMFGKYIAIQMIFRFSVKIKNNKYPQFSEKMIKEMRIFYNEKC